MGQGLSNGAGDPMAVAAARLEMAVQRLAEALSRPRAVSPAAPADAVPREQVVALAARLDAAITRLRQAMAEEGRHPDPPEGEE